MTEFVGDRPDYGCTSSLPTEADPQSSTSSSAHFRAARWLVMIVSIANVLVAAAALVLIWKVAANTPVPTRISNTVWIAGSLLIAVVIFLIGWRGCDHPGNLVLALAFAFAGSNDISWTLLEQLRANGIVRQAVNFPTFVLGAGFFILASARFPRKVTPLDIASSGTIWGRIRPLRAVLTLFLRASAVWALVGIPAIVIEFIDRPVYAHVHWFVIVLMALIYFYINYRSGDAETRRKVLWFFELTLALLVMNLVRHGIQAVLPNNTSETVRVLISALYYAAFVIVQVFCICMAVFYAGAISPTLVIRKTFVYGVTVALLLFVYATAEAFVANFLVEKIGVSNSFASALLGTVLALAFHPIKNRMEHTLKRLGPQTTPVPVKAQGN